MTIPFNRRQFLKTSALAAAAGVSVPLWPARVRAALVEETSVLMTTNAATSNPVAWRRDTPELVAAALQDLPAMPAGPGLPSSRITRTLTGSGTGSSAS